MSLNILLLEDVHASATPILQTIHGVEVMRLKHAPDVRELKILLANVQGLQSHDAIGGDEPKTGLPVRERSCIAFACQ
ncbi:MAG TPA: hypothetical protein VIM34_00035 [Burkholderiaceae bacterium]